MSLPMERSRVGDMATNTVSRYLQSVDGLVLPVEAASQYEEIDFVLLQGGEPKLLDAKGSLSEFHREHRINRSIGSTWSMSLESLVKHQSWKADVYYMFCHPEVEPSVFTCTAKSLIHESLKRFKGTDGKDAVVITEHCVAPAQEVFG